MISIASAESHDIEPKKDFIGTESEMTGAIEKHVLNAGRSSYENSGVREDWRNSLDFSIKVTLLPHGTFANYSAQRQTEGSDLAHIKPPHVNPSDKVLSLLLSDTDETIIVKKSGTKIKETARPESSLTS